MILKDITLFLLLLSAHAITAQVEYLRLSPAQTIVQRVGATDLTITCSRPQMKGRKIFGSMIPYGKMWRTGANENTTLEFSHRVKIGEVEIPAGKYALFSKPDVKQWEIFLYTDTNNMEVPDPVDASKLIYLTVVPTRKLSQTEETLVLNIYDITETTASLGISWEQTEVRIPIQFYTREAMEKQIEAELKQNIMDYSITASYYYQRGIELERAKELMELVMELKEAPNEWNYHSYGVILHKLGEKEAAKKNLEIALQMAKDLKNEYIITEVQKLLVKY